MASAKSKAVVNLQEALAILIDLEKEDEKEEEGEYGDDKSEDLEAVLNIGVLVIIHLMENALLMCLNLALMSVHIQT